MSAAGSREVSPNPSRPMLTGPALYSGSAPQLVSARSASLLAQRETQRIQLLFLLLDAAGIGSIDASVSPLIADIPNPLDRKIVTAIFARMERKAAKQQTQGASDSSSDPATIAQMSSSSDTLNVTLSPLQLRGEAQPAGHMSMPAAAANWSLTFDQFASLFRDEYRRHVQREGPQASSSMAGVRESAAASRAMSGANTPGAGHSSRRGSAHGSMMHRARSSSPHQTQPHAYLHSGTGTGGKGHTRQASLGNEQDRSRSASPHSSRSSRSASRRGSARFASTDFDGLNASGAGADADFRPHLSRRSEELANRNHTALLASLAADGGFAPALAHAQPVTTPGGSVSQLPPSSSVLQPHLLGVGVAGLTASIRRSEIERMAGLAQAAPRSRSRSPASTSSHARRARERSNSIGAAGALALSISQQQAAVAQQQQQLQAQQSLTASAAAAAAGPAHPTGTPTLQSLAAQINSEWQMAH